jgi:hypothetical protein
MILAPLLAAAVIVVGLNVTSVIDWVHSLPLLGPFFQRTVSPKAGSTLIFLSVLCPAIPALLAVFLCRAVVRFARDWKAQRIRERRKAAWLSRAKAVTPAVERLAQRKVGD